MAEPAEDGDRVEVEPVTVIGQRMGELVDVPKLVERMEAEDPHVQLAADLAAKLEADRDQYLEALTPQSSRELVERLAAAKTLGGWLPWQPAGHVETSRQGREGPGGTGGQQ